MYIDLQKLNLFHIYFFMFVGVNILGSIGHVQLDTAEKERMCEIKRISHLLDQN